MSKGQMLRSLVKQRLTAAVEEIFELFNKTITEYEEELYRSKTENERQQKLLDSVLKAPVPSNTTECASDIQQMSVTKEDDPPEPQEWSPVVDQEDPEPPSIKQEEEQEELWTGQEGEPLQWQMTLLPGTGFMDFKLKECPTDVQQLVVDEEVGPSEKQEWSPSLDQKADLGDYGRSDATMKVVPIKDSNGQTAQNSSPFPKHAKIFGNNTSLERHIDTHTGDGLVGPSAYGTGFSQEIHSVHHILHPASCVGEMNVTSPHRHIMNNNNDFPISDTGCSTRLHQCTECGKTFDWKSHLMIHMRVHTGEKPFDCSMCGKRFAHKSNLITHMSQHAACINETEGNSDGNYGLSDVGRKIKQFHCMYCDKCFYWKSHLEIHMRVHTGEKPFGCSECGKRFAHKSNLITHLTRHTGDQSMGCSAGQRHFRRKNMLLGNIKIVTREDVHSHTIRSLEAERLEPTGLDQSNNSDEESI
ncbi:gastrula zinc finger protein XlCGF57.1-like isoform X3 [Sphaeramia orbicularis]|uniref:gastrula zinc finger protein XlCGF57.1-like isoform X3 n=1 Tax=Sphaeramia orbicularis TaxID=375764 RepID=UPI00117D2344|nr:gastrula zinc finger protein XlCGF57.1-like isoform X3 [Sphaeramia orbicularis]